MKVALIGATGFVGSRLLAEALARGHQVTALVRSPEKLTRHPALTPRKADVFDVPGLAAQLAGHDAVIDAFSPGTEGPDVYRLYVEGGRSILEAVRRSGVSRLLVVGGAGSLEVAPGVQLVDTPEFPAGWKAGALAARIVLLILRGEHSLQWTFLSPSALLEPGARTGRFRLGTDQLLTGGKGQSRISVEDYAVAMIDELEKPAHLRQRFTVGY